MCIVCHYKSDNKLVTPEVRAKAHWDHNPQCLRKDSNNNYTCFDCGATNLPDSPNHVCSDLGSVKGTRRDKQILVGDNWTNVH